MVKADIFQEAAHVRYIRLTRIWGRLVIIADRCAIRVQDVPTTSLLTMVRRRRDSFHSQYI